MTLKELDSLDLKDRVRFIVSYAKGKLDWFQNRYPKLKSFARHIQNAEDFLNDKFKFDEYWYNDLYNFFIVINSYEKEGSIFKDNGETIIQD